MTAGTSSLFALAWLLASGGNPESYLGLRASLSAFAEEEAEADPDLAPGLAVTAVVENSPAEAAGVQAGDVILALNGEPARTPAQLRQLQFHCGKPPPAALPSVVMRIVVRIETTPRRACPRGAASRASRQRAATYIVISKPRRTSVATGVCHCMESPSWSGWQRAPWHPREPHDSTPHAGAVARPRTAPRS